MQSWFFLADKKRPKRLPPKKEPEVRKKASMAEILSQEWTFTVAVPNIGPKEKAFITGSCPVLGNWNFKKIVILENDEGTDLWSKSIVIPNTCDVLYRYGKIYIHEESDAMLIREWETNIKPRVIKVSMLHPITDTFGEYDGGTSITKGWLTDQTLLQFKFLNNPLKLKTNLTERPILIKVTPVKLSYANDSQSDDTSPTNESADGINPGVLVEVSTYDTNPALCVPKPQEQFGREYRLNDAIIVNMTVPNYKTLAYVVDIYSYSSYCAPEGPPCHVGYTYVLPNMFTSSEGLLILPVTCNVKHRPLGSVNIEYLIIHPLLDNLCNFKVSYSKYWDSKWKGLEVGHRGSGASFKIKGAPIRENTIASLKTAALQGADMLEFDVQLSKDLVPIIYHDYHVCISLKRKKEVAFAEMLELPVKDLTLEQLQKLKVYHLVEGRNQQTLFDDEELEEHQPFPTLEHALKTLDPSIGFNIEVKWTMQMNDGSFELKNPFDMNMYIDKILEVVLTKSAKRHILFSCFNPDICTMLRNKQNKYPVMFLTVGITSRYKPYLDPRCATIPMAVHHAVSSDLLGLCAHTEDLLRDPNQVKEGGSVGRPAWLHELSSEAAGAAALSEGIDPPLVNLMQCVTDANLVIFCWGDDNNDKTTIKKLKKMGLHGVIYDKLDQGITTEVICDEDLSHD